MCADSCSYRRIALWSISSLAVLVFRKIHLSYPLKVINEIFFFKYHYKCVDFTVFYMFHCTTVIILFSSSFIEISQTSCSCSAAQSCPILCNPMDCSPPGSSVQEDSPGRNTGVGCHFLLQGIFPTQGIQHCICLRHTA